MIQNSQRRIFNVRIILVVGFLSVFTFTSFAWADNVVTANLNTTPSSFVKPGGTIKFKATFFHTPDFPVQPGGIVRCWVTRHDFSWISEKRDIEYPGMGTVSVNFAKGFTVPSDATSGQVFDFYLVYGIWYPISNKASVKVLYLRKKVIKKIEQTPKVIKKEETPKVQQRILK